MESRVCGYAITTLTKVFLGSAFRSLNPAFCSFDSISCLFPLPPQPPALHPGCQTHVISPPRLPSALERQQKASLALPAALVAYLNPSNPLPQHSTLNYCLHLICSLSTKLLSVTHFPPHLHTLTLAQRVCMGVCLCETRPHVLKHSGCDHYWINILLAVCLRILETGDCHCLYLLVFKDIYDNINHLCSLFTSTRWPVLGWYCLVAVATAAAIDGPVAEGQFWC